MVALTSSTLLAWLLAPSAREVAESAISSEAFTTWLFASIIERTAFMIGFEINFPRRRASVMIITIKIAPIISELFLSSYTGIKTSASSISAIMFQLKSLNLIGA